MPRMRILPQAAQEQFDTPPQFDHRKRQQAFDLSVKLIETAQTLRTTSSQIEFLILCGYFKMSKQFYLPQDFHSRDIETAARKLALSASDFNFTEYRETTRLRHQKMILDFYGFRPFGNQAVKAIETEIVTMAQQYLKPRLIFELCTDFIIQQKFQLPKAGTLLELYPDS